MSVVILKWEMRVVDIALASGHRAVVVVDDDDERRHASVINAYADRVEFLRLDSFDSVPSILLVAGQLAMADEAATVVYSHLEATQFAAGILNDTICNTRKMLPLALRTRDKAVMKRALRAAGIDTARYVSVPSLTDPACVKQRLSKELGWPVILKPVDGRGAKNVWVLNDESQFDAWSISAARLSKTFWISEELVAGDEYHVDTIWFEGAAKYTFVGKYERPPRLVLESETGNATVYLPAGQPDRVKVALIDLVERAVQCLGIESGVTHAELFVCPNGRVVLSEIATRPAGGAHDDCVRVLVGEGLKELGLRALLGWFGGAPDPTKADGRAVGFVNLVPDSPGQITVLPSSEELSLNESVREVVYALNKGDDYRPSGACTWCVMPVVETDRSETCFSEIMRLRSDFKCYARA